MLRLISRMFLLSLSLSFSHTLTNSFFSLALGSLYRGCRANAYTIIHHAYEEIDRTKSDTHSISMRIVEEKISLREKKNHHWMHSLLCATIEDNDAKKENQFNIWKCNLNFIRFELFSFFVCMCVRLFFIRLYPLLQSVIHIYSTCFAEISGSLLSHTLQNGLVDTIVVVCYSPGCYMCVYTL